MKTYEEMSNSVLEKVRIRKAVQKRRTRIVMGTVGICCLLLLVTAMGRNTTPQEPAIQMHNPTNVLQTDPTKQTDVQTEKPNIAPSVKVLCATSDGVNFKALNENVKVPCKAELRVRDVTGMSEEERQQVLEAENAYVRETVGEIAEEGGYSRYCLDNVIVTMVSAGEFSIAFDDIEAVSRIEISATENGYIFYPRISGIKYKSWDENGLTVEVDGDKLRKGLAMLDTDTFAMTWSIGRSVADRFNEDPDMEMAQIRDHITIKVAYTDGRVETKTVVMQACDNGQMTILLLDGTLLDQIPG